MLAQNPNLGNLKISHTPTIPPTKHSLSFNVPLTGGTVLGSGQFLGLDMAGPFATCFGHPFWRLSTTDMLSGIAIAKTIHGSNK
jgi:hypothetical protein